MHPTNFSLLASALALSMPSGVPLPNLRPSRRARTPAPINWASLRGDLDLMREAREGVLLLGMYNSPDASETSEYLRIALRASSEYILELTRCIAERPQGKGGWQRAVKLDALREQIMAAIDAG